MALTYLIDDARTKALYDSRATAESFAAAEKGCVELALPGAHQAVRRYPAQRACTRPRTAARIGLPAIPGLVAALSEGGAQSKITTADALTRLEEYLPTGGRTAATWLPWNANSQCRSLRLCAVEMPPCEHGHSPDCRTPLGSGSPGGTTTAAGRAEVARRFHAAERGQSAGTGPKGNDSQTVGSSNSHPDIPACRTNLHSRQQQRQLKTGGTFDAAWG